MREVIHVACTAASAGGDRAAVLAAIQKAIPPPPAGPPPHDIDVDLQAMLNTTIQLTADPVSQAELIRSKNPLRVALQSDPVTDLTDEIKALLMHQTFLAYYQAEQLGVEMIGDTCFEENYKVWSQKEHEGNNADGPYGILNHHTIDPIQKHQISGEYLTLMSNSRNDREKAIVEEYYKIYTGEEVRSKVGGSYPPQIPPRTPDQQAFRGMANATDDDFPIDAKYADDHPITFVHPSRIDVPVRVIHRRIVKWVKRFNRLQDGLVAIFQKRAPDKTSIELCVAILHVMREIVDDVKRYIEIYNLEKRDLDRYAARIQEDFPNVEPFWDEIPLHQPTIHNNLEEKLKMAEDLFTIYSNINWKIVKDGLMHAFRSDMPFYPIDGKPNMEIISVGDTLLGMMKEEWLFEMVENKTPLEAIERMRYHEVASNILSKWLDYAARFVVYKKVKKEINDRTTISIFDDFLKPKLHITVEDGVKGIYEKYQPQLTSIHVMLSEDYDSLVPDWEFNQTFQVLDNIKIMAILEQVKEVWGDDHPEEWMEWYQRLLEFFIEHFNDGVFEHKLGMLPFENPHHRSLVHTEQFESLTKSLQDYVTKKKAKIQPDTEGLLNDTLRAVTDVDNGFLVPSNMMKKLSPYSSFLSSLTEKIKTLSPRDLLNKNEDIHQTVLSEIETIIRDIWESSLFASIQEHVLGNAILIDPTNIHHLPEKLVFAVLKLRKKDPAEDDFVYPSDPQTYDVETVMEEVASRFKDESNVIDKIIAYYKNLGIRMVKDLHSIASNYLRHKIHQQALENIETVLTTP
jgi:hypothetical protein